VWEDRSEIALFINELFLNIRSAGAKMGQRLSMIRGCQSRPSACVEDYHDL